MRKVCFFIVLLAMIGGLISCADADSSEVPIPTEPVPTVVQATEPPPRPTPTLLPQIIYVEVTPTPGPPTPPPLEHTPGPESGVADQPKETPVPTATKGPPPTPTPKYHPAEPPKGLGYNGFSYNNEPQLVGKVLSFQAVINGQGHEPTQVQVWHALRKDATNARCSTDQPVALIAQGAGTTDATQMQWEFCSHQGAQPEIHVNDVPWVRPKTWSYTSRNRKLTTDPYLNDWSFGVDLGDSRVQKLAYQPGAGYIVVIFSGEEILSKIWVEE